MGVLTLVRMCYRGSSKGQDVRYLLWIALLGLLVGGTRFAWAHSSAPTEDTAASAPPTVPTSDEPSLVPKSSSGVSVPKVEGELEPTRTEWSLIPALGRNTDLGFLMGGVFVLADFDPQHSPYHWRTVNTAAFSVKEVPEGATVPWSAVLSQWDVTGLWDGNLRVITEASYSRTENEGYFGLGSNSDPEFISRESTPDWNHRYQYLILEPRFRLNGRYSLSDEVDVWAGTYMRYIDVGTYEGSRLELDSNEGASGAGQGVYGTEPHGFFQGAVGVSWDTRDHETSPTRGIYGEISMRGAFALPSDEDIHYGWLDRSSSRLRSVGWGLAGAGCPSAHG